MEGILLIILIILVIFNILILIPNKINELRDKQGLHFKEIQLRLNRLEELIEKKEEN